MGRWICVVGYKPVRRLKDRGQFSHAPLNEAPNSAPGKVLLGADLLELLQAGRYGLDPLPALADSLPDFDRCGAVVEYLGYDRGVISVRGEDVAPAVSGRDP